MANLGDKVVKQGMEAEHTEPRGNAASRAPLARVLLIEDNLGLSSGMRVLLESLGYTVYIAHDGDQGLRLARDVEPDVVICDLSLPSMSGYRVARCLRQEERTRNIRLIAVTGYGYSTCAGFARQAGFDGFLAKPVTIEELRDALRYADAWPDRKPSSGLASAADIRH